MASIKEKIAYALGDAAAGGIVWKVMSIAFPLFFTNVFGLSFADAAVLMLVARMFDVDNLHYFGLKFALRVFPLVCNLLNCSLIHSNY